VPRDRGKYNPKTKRGDFTLHERLAGARRIYSKKVLRGTRAGETQNRCLTIGAIFRQDLFGPRTKIKFRFLLVASQPGFYDQSAGRKQKPVNIDVRKLLRPVKAATQTKLSTIALAIVAAITAHKNPWIALPLIGILGLIVVSLVLGTTHRR
jgi:hypothetical protein